MTNPLHRCRPFYLFSEASSRNSYASTVSKSDIHRLKETGRNVLSERINLWLKSWYTAGRADEMW